MRLLQFPLNETSEELCKYSVAAGSDSFIHCAAVKLAETFGCSASFFLLKPEPYCLVCPSVLFPPTPLLGDSYTVGNRAGLSVACLQTCQVHCVISGSRGDSRKRRLGSALLPT